MKGSKLVRDKIIEIKKREGEKPAYEIVRSASKRKEVLFAKFQEELEEVFLSTTKADIMEELADVLEIVEGYASLHKIPFKKILEIKA